GAGAPVRPGRTAGSRPRAAGGRPRAVAGDQPHAEAGDRPPGTARDRPRGIVGDRRGARGPRPFPTLPGAAGPWMDRSRPVCSGDTDTPYGYLPRAYA